jgi:acetyltransferase-like isoleucine patch superfamily enzyme
MFKARLRRLFIRLLVWGVQTPRIIIYRLLSNNQFYGKPTRFQPIQAVGRGKIVFEDGVKIGVFPSPFFFSTYAYIEARNPNAKIVIGENTWINNNFSAISESAGIKIGRRCLIGANVEIIDSDFHGIKVSDRCTSDPEKARPVVIGDDVFIGSNVKIMKGVVIGVGTVIANGSIVVSEIPPNSIAGGNPAKVLKVIEA